MFLSVRIQLGSVSRLLRLKPREPVADVADTRMSIGGPMVGAIGLFEANHSPLGGPVEREVDMRSEFQIGQFSTLGDRLDDFGREKREPDKAGDVAIRNAFVADASVRKRGRYNAERRPAVSRANLGHVWRPLTEMTDVVDERVQLNGSLDYRGVMRVEGLVKGYYNGREWFLAAWTSDFQRQSSP